MKREIKFRAWHPQFGEMVYSNMDSEFQDKREWYPICFAVGFSHYPHSIADDRTIIMQFTGLKDKNGKDIYEGDIVNGVYETDSDSNATKSELRIVEFGNYSFRLSTASGETKNRLSEYFYFEVIGNIYENPELLK